uniref:Ig-like domain-containing protein n=1 Tax=Strigamia maritima TaxID=126957 RepID=T1J779_STRMM
MVVKESMNVSLSCHASGYPTPHIRWQREDGKMIALNSQHDVIAVDSQDLNISRVSRLHMGAYLCIATNGVPPAVSKRIVLKVHFPPMIWIPHQLVAGTIDADVTLECHTEAYPKSINYWTTDKGEMITSGDKYTAVAVDSTYQVHMRLKIHHLDYNDFGSYRCIAKNSLGETGGSIRLYEVPASTPVSTSTEKVNFESKGHLGETKLKLNSIETNEKDFKLPSGRKPSSPDEPKNIHTQPRPQADTVNNSSCKQVTQLSSTLCLLLLVTLVA